MTEERNDLLQEAQALTELSERTRTFPLYFYEPASEASAGFHRDPAIIRILSGGNRSGKTHANVAECAAAALGYRPWALREVGIPPPRDPGIRPLELPVEALVHNGAGIRISVPSQICVVTGLSMAKGIGQVFHPKLKALLGPQIASERLVHGGVPGSVTLKNGSVIHYSSAEMDFLAFEGVAYDAIFIDEPIPKRIYTALRRGSVDNFAKVCMTFTPIGPAAPWIFRDLYNNKDRKRVAVFTVSIYQNRFLSPEAIEEFATDPTLGELEKQARLYGRFQHLADRIYDFDDAVHVLPAFSPPSDWFVGMAIDPATVKPWAIAYFAVSPRGDFYIFKEHPSEEFIRLRRDTRSLADYATLIRSLDGSLGVSIRLMDPNYGPRSDTVRGVFIPSIASELAAYGLHFQTQITDDLDFGEAKVRSMLSFARNRPIDALNRPRLYVTENCPNVIAALSFYTHKIKRGTETPDETGRDETYKDFADVVRYIAVALGNTPAPSAYTDEDPVSDSTLAGYGEENADA